MNPFDLSASDLLIWGIVLHFLADWPLQNDWMANNKMKRKIKHDAWLRQGELGTEYTTWWHRHPAAYVHAGIHCVFLALVFGWVAVPLAVAHLIIDCRWPVARWSKLMRQTQPKMDVVQSYNSERDDMQTPRATPLYDIGLEVRIWNDQVFHIVCVAIAAILVTL